MKGRSAGDARPVAVWPGEAAPGRRMSGYGALGKGTALRGRASGRGRQLPAAAGEGGRAAGRRLPVAWARCDARAEERDSGAEAAPG